MMTGDRLWKDKAVCLFIFNNNLINSKKQKKMKKVFLLMAAACVTAAANATILRVSNVTGSSAPYSTIEAAHEAAIPGDTIMVEGSVNDYGWKITISKKIVLIGPGYNQVSNGLVNEGMNSARIQNLILDYKEIVVSGMTITSDISISKENNVVNRCNLAGVTLKSGATGAIIHQNYISGGIAGGSVSNVSVTNNVFVSSEAYRGRVNALRNSTFSYNTCVKEVTSTDSNYFFLYDFEGCTVEHNILNMKFDATSTNLLADNYVFTETPFYNTSSEIEIRKTELGFSEGKYGAFSGDDPYVISGIPAGPVIEDITVPASVEKGKKLNVTIKLGLQK